MDEAMLQEMEAREKRQKPIRDKLVADDPGLPSISAAVMAGDFDSAARAYDALMAEDPMAIEPISAGKEGVEPTPRWLWAAEVRVGSYARMDFVKRLVVEGVVPPQDVFPHLLDLWRGADAPDTDLWWLGMFYEAWLRNEHRTLVDKPGAVLQEEWLKVYRGQSRYAPVGFSWSLKKEVAAKFATTGGGRALRDDGVVYTGKVNAEDVYAYMVQRGEEELITDKVMNMGRLGKA